MATASTPTLYGRGLSANLVGARYTATQSTTANRKFLDSWSVNEGNLRQLLTFDGCPELLRGCRLHTVMRRGAAIFESSKGDASTYALSEETRRLQVFCSHNWVVSRWSKFCCLAFHFNKRLALAAAIAVLIAVSVPGALGLLPTYTFNGFKRTFGARVLTAPITLFVGLFGRDLLPCVKGPVVFLDKVCIHQEDADLQRRAILKLGAFLRHSDKMLILYTDIYFTKLWTIFELASYLSQYPVERICLIHCSVPVFCFFGWLLFYINDMVVLVGNIAADFYHLEVPLVALAFIIFSKFLRDLARSRQSMHTQLASFSVRACTCVCESDREVVYENIVQMVRSLDEQALSRDAALDRFDALVKEEIPKAVAKSLGRMGVRYHHIAWTSATLFIPRAVDCLVGLRYDLHWRVFMTEIVLFYIAWSVVVIPIVVIVLFKASALQLQRRGRAQWLICAAAGLAGVLVVAASQQLLVGLEAWARRSDWAMIAYGLGVAAAGRGVRAALHAPAGRCRRGTDSSEVKAFDDQQELALQGDGGDGGGDGSGGGPEPAHSELLEALQKAVV